MIDNTERIEQLKQFIKELEHKLDHQPYYCVMAVKADHNKLMRYKEELKALLP